MNKLLRYSLVKVLALFLLFGCGNEKSYNNDTEDEIAPSTNGIWYQPPIFATWQWQLTGEINSSYSVDMYDIDLFDSSEVLIKQIQAANIKVICYFSAGSYEVMQVISLLSK